MRENTENAPKKNQGKPGKIRKNTEKSRKLIGRKTSIQHEGTYGVGAPWH